MNESDKNSVSRAQWSYVFLVLAVTVGSILYRAIRSVKMEQTSLLFVGIPAVLAILLALTPKAQTVRGGIFKGITLALLLSGPLLGEGFICILMASPIFYLVGAIVAAVVGYGRRKHANVTYLALILLPLSIEGSSPRLSFDRNETVSASKVVAARALEVERAISRGPRTDLRLPVYLRMGFPRATASWGEGLEVGATRTIHFAGGEGRPGDLVVRVVEHRPGYVREVKVADRSKIAHWLDWNSAEIEWAPVDPVHTRVTWTFHFTRRLDPAWYFRPWERYAVRLAAEYLIDANATPGPTERH
jgi:hypothetical protein